MTNLAVPQQHRRRQRPRALQPEAPGDVGRRRGVDRGKDGGDFHVLGARGELRPRLGQRGAAGRRRRRGEQHTPVFGCVVGFRLVGCWGLRGSRGTVSNVAALHIHLRARAFFDLFDAASLLVGCDRIRWILTSVQSSDQWMPASGARNWKNRGKSWASQSPRQTSRPSAEPPLLPYDPSSLKLDADVDVF